MTKPNQVRTDGDLLAEFVVSGSQTAFAEAVQRHASMVHGVCWRVLSDRHEAQDAAQAAFVTLARKAASLRHAPSIGGWLHRVAWCIAQNTRIARSRRQQREVRVMEQISHTDPSPIDVAAIRLEPDRVVN